MAKRGITRAGDLNPIFWSAKNVARAYLKLVGLKENNSKSERIVNRLFSKSSCFGRAYKFDFSFDLNSELNNWRFTYNDKGEKDLPSRILSIFKLLDCYEPDKINKMFKIVDMPLTFGIDWNKKDTEPKLKLEFELGEKDAGSLRGVFPMLGLNAEMAEEIFDKLHDIVAVSFAFKGKKAIGWKVYSKCEPAEFHKMPHTKEILEDAKKFFVDGSDSFCLIGYRFDKNSSLQSIKFYKVYEHRAGAKEINKRIIDGRHKGIRNLLNKKNAEKFDCHISLFNRVCSKHGTLVYPAIISWNYKYKEKDFNRITLYLSIMLDKQPKCGTHKE